MPLAMPVEKSSGAVAERAEASCLALAF